MSPATRQAASAFSPARTSLPASAAVQAAINEGVTGDVLVVFESRQVGKTARQIGHNGHIDRGLTLLGLGGLKTPARA